MHYTAKERKFPLRPFPPTPSISPTLDTAETKEMEQNIFAKKSYKLYYCKMKFHIVSHSDQNESEYSKSFHVKHLVGNPTEATNPSCINVDA